MRFFLLVSKGIIDRPTTITSYIEKERSIFLFRENLIKELKCLGSTNWFG